MQERKLFSNDVPAIVVFDGKYRWLSNFDEHDVPYEGNIYPTSEHAYQAAKTADPDERQRVASASSPSAAKRLGQKVTMSPDFEARKLRVMHDVLLAKFTYHPILANKLIETYPAYLSEGNTWHDNFWGDCHCSRCATRAGSNQLGYALMQVRLELMATAEDNYGVFFMGEAARLAEKNLETGDGGPFGAIVVKDDRVVGRGRNRVLANHDSTAHAEVEAIRDAERNLGTHDLSGCEIYTSCFPCPMCLGAIAWANITRCYYGNTKEDADAIGFRDDDFYTLLAFITAGKEPSEAGIDFELVQLDKEETIKAFEEYSAANGQMY